VRHQAVYQLRLVGHVHHHLRQAAKFRRRGAQRGGEGRAAREPGRQDVTEELAGPGKSFLRSCAVVRVARQPQPLEVGLRPERRVVRPRAARVGRAAPRDIYAPHVGRVDIERCGDGERSLDGRVIADVVFDQDAPKSALDRPQPRLGADE